MQTAGTVTFTHYQQKKKAKNQLRGYISIEASGNIVVIKTFPGHANPVCNAIDNMNFEEILGTVAGDNCMFACTKEGVTAEQFIEKLKKLIPEIE